MSARARRDEEPRALPGKHQVDAGACGTTAGQDGAARDPTVGAGSSPYGSTAVRGTSRRAWSSVGCSARAPIRACACAARVRPGRLTGCSPSPRPASLGRGGGYLGGCVLQRYGRCADQAELDGLAGQERVEQPVGAGADAVAGPRKQVVAAGHRLGDGPGQRHLQRVGRRLEPAQVDREAQVVNACTDGRCRARRRRRCCGRRSCPAGWRAGRSSA